MRILAYARVSSRDQALGTSLQDQQNALAAYASTRGLTVAKFYVEAESAVYEKQERREQIRRLMQELQRGDLVLCDKLDRWSRDPEFTYRSMREVREAGARVYFVGESLDPSTPEGDSMLNMRVLMAREEHKRIRLRTVGTRKLLRNQGLYAEGAVPLGYKRQLARGQRGIEKNVLVVDQPAAAIALRLFKAAAAGASLDRLQTLARELWDAKKWDRRTIHMMLRNRLYLGEVKDARGVWIKAKHPALITPELFARVQTGLTERRKGGPRIKENSRTRDWILRGYAWCAECGKRMVSAYSGEHIYYKCRYRCGASHVPVRQAEEEVTEAVVARLHELREELTRPSTPSTPPPDLDGKRVRLDAKRERLLEQNADGHITREQLAIKLAKLDHERTVLEAQVAPPDNTEARVALLASLEGIEKAWRHTTPAERGQIIRELASKVEIARGALPRITWRTIVELTVS